MTDKETIKELSTEEKILSAASKVFTEKGFAGTRTRDIAQEAGINIALLNYYFRSKEKLFQKVMLLKLHELFSEVIPIISDAETDLKFKIESATESYFKILIKNPGLPVFILSEIQNNSINLTHTFPVGEMLKHSVILEQIKEVKPDIDPLQILFSFLGMTIFPFITKPIFTAFEIIDDVNFEKFIQERKKMIPVWIELMLKN